MRKTMMIAILAFIPTVLIAADFEDAMSAYERQNYRQAYAIFSELADSDDAYAQYMLGRLYAAGNGTIQDYVEAHKWFNLAAARGHSHASNARDRVANNMSQRQIGRAQRLARQWRPGGEQTESTRTTDRDSRPSGSRPSDDNRLSRAEIVAGIQQSLNNLGYNAGSVDGKMGGRTERAIRNYQSDNNLTVDGEASRALFDHLHNNQASVTASRPSRDDREPARETQPRPRQFELLRDNFRDGDYTRNPRWLVAQGEFNVERGVGLRTVQRLYDPLPRGESAEEQALNLIIGAVLEQATGQNLSRQPEYAEIYTSLPISNAFAIEVRLSSLSDVGSIEFGTYQGTRRTSGYRLVYTANGRTRGLALLRQSRSGSNVVESSSVPIRLEDGRPHTLQWIRDSNAEMTVSIDNQTLMRVSDRGFRDPFDGFTMVNRGGDYGIRRVIIQGTE